MASGIVFPILFYPFNICFTQRVVQECNDHNFGRARRYSFDAARRVCTPKEEEEGDQNDAEYHQAQSSLLSPYCCRGF